MPGGISIMYTFSPLAGLLTAPDDEPGMPFDAAADLANLQAIATDLDDMLARVDTADVDLRAAIERAYYECEKLMRQRYGCQMCTTGACLRCGAFRRLQQKLGGLEL